MTDTAKQASELDMHKQALGYLFARQPQTNGEIAEVMEDFAKDRLQEREKETAALREEVERLRQALKQYADWHGAVHESDCPEDDTCRCGGKSINDAVNAALREGR